MRIQLLYVPDCPLTDRVRARVHVCLAQAGVSVPVEEARGQYPSPTLLVDGIDVVTGRTPTPTGIACCRLDLPTDPQILAALCTAAGVTDQTATGSSSPNPSVRRSRHPVQS